MRRKSLELFVASFLMLFVELVLIRWAGAYVVYLSYFSNFVLLGSFLGIGLGFLRAARRPDLFRFAPLGLVLFAAAIYAQPVVIDRSGSDLIYFGSLTYHGLPAWLVLPFVFLAVTAIMTAVAHAVAIRFADFPPLDAYRLDILGSLAGIAIYASLSWFGAPPLAWGSVIVLLATVLIGARDWRQWIPLAALLALFAAASFEPTVVWSPYYRVEVLPWYIRVNGIPHQAMVTTAGTYYEIPYQRIGRRLENVLVIGAGNGNDVSAALHAGARHVDAVEIDPRLQDIGRRLHPEKPYADPRVRPIVTDGRAFLERTDRRYDLIIFALPDSLTLVSGQSAIRLESYLFTRQAIEAARAHLAPGGTFVMYNYYREDWLLDRLGGTLATVFGSAPCLELGPHEPGSDIGRLAMLLASDDPSSFACTKRWQAASTPVVEPADDDHPFVYLKERSVPTRYLWTLGLVLAVSMLLVRTAGGRFGRIFAPRGALDLFLMGAAFMLLETKSVVQFALLFGTTWFVNALVFLGILLAIYLAIEVERRFAIDRPALLFPLLFAGLAIAYLVPTGALLSLAPWPRFFAATALAFFPVFVANLAFAERFRKATEPTTEFGANLLGAMAGGALEYLSLVTGYRALLIVAAALYLGAWWFGSRREAAQATV